MQMVDPLTALMYAVQVMNFLKMLITKTLKERQETNVDDASLPCIDPSDENGPKNPPLLLEVSGEEGSEQLFLPNEALLDSPTTHLREDNLTTDKPSGRSPASEKSASPGAAAENPANEPLCEIAALTNGTTSGPETAANGSNVTHANSRRNKTGRSSHKKGARKAKGHSAGRAALPAEKSRGASIVCRINSKVERIEAWR